MSTTTITAEGGTIKLTTAESGEVTAVSSDFSVTVVQQVVGGGSGVTEYATLAELYDAAFVTETLTEGYYEVLTVPRFITYWDGVDFDPPLTLPPPVALDHWWHRDALLDLADNADVTTWIAGSGQNLIHDGMSQLPKFRTADGGYLEITNTGTQLLQATSIVDTQPTTIFIYSDFGGITGSGASGAVFDGITGRNHLFLGSPGSNFSMFAGSVVDCGVVANVASKRLVTCVFNGASSVAYANKTKGSTISAGATGLNGFRLGANNTKANTGAQKTRFVGILFRVATDQEVSDMHDYCVEQFG